MDIANLARRVCAYADARGAGSAPVTSEIDGLSVVRQRAPSPIAPTLYEPLLCVVLSGTKEAYLGTHKVCFGACETLLVGLHLPTIGRVVEASPAKPYVALALALELEILRELNAEIHGSRHDDAPPPALASGDADEALLDAMERLFGLIDKPEARAILTPLVKREIHYWALRAQHGAMLREISRVDGHAARIAAATVRIRGAYTEPLRVADLARDVGMSPSAFHDHFRAVTGTTPLQYQKRLRLLEARRLLRERGSSVSRAAYAVGYESAAQFSREFARMFGHPPREDRALAPAESVG
ncbi:MAG: AraC family transcriptional regulator [Acuticoccus sp.]